MTHTPPDDTAGLIAYLRSGYGTREERDQAAAALTDRLADRNPSVDEGPAVTAPTGSGHAFRCEVCDGEPMWSITRIGDVATTWACPTDLSTACDRMQRDFEVTELRITHHAKAVEWSQLGQALAQMPNNPDPAAWRSRPEGN